MPNTTLDDVGDETDHAPGAEVSGQAVSSLWVSWRGLASAADPSWIGSALQTWASNIMGLADANDRIDGLRVDCLVSRVRRGREQVSRMRVSFLSGGGAPTEATFSTWERTLQQVIEARVGLGGIGERVPESAKVAVQRLETRSRRFRDGGGA